jgi:hypothetical protein
MSIVVELATHVGALVGGILLHAFIAPPIHRKVEEVKARHARARMHKRQLPDPPPGFNFYVRENLHLPVMSLFGTPTEPMSMGDVSIDFNPRLTHEVDDYPHALRDAIQPLLTEYLAARPGTEITDNSMPRYLGYIQGGERDGDTRGKITLRFGLTTYFAYCATNCSLDIAAIPDEGKLWGFIRNRTLREAYMPVPYRTEATPFANPLSSHCVVISRNSSQSPANQVLIQRRGDKVALYRGYYQSSAAGYVTTSHRDQANKPSPFVAAAKEANQEVADRLKATPVDYKLLGVAVNWGELDINAYGFIETGFSASELIGDTSRDSYEGWIEAIPFTPHAVFSHIAKNRWEAMGAMALCQTLLAFFSDQEINTEARRMPTKPWREFCDRPMDR